MVAVTVMLGVVNDLSPCECLCGLCSRTAVGAAMVIPNVTIAPSVTVVLVVMTVNVLDVVGMLYWTSLFSRQYEW